MWPHTGKQRATGELNFLAGLISAPSAAGDEEGGGGGEGAFKLNLFPDDGGFKVRGAAAAPYYPI